MDAASIERAPAHIKQTFVSDFKINENFFTQPLFPSICIIYVLDTTVHYSQKMNTSPNW